MMGEFQVSCLLILFLVVAQARIFSMYVLIVNLYLFVMKRVPYALQPRRWNTCLVNSYQPS